MATTTDIKNALSHGSSNSNPIRQTSRTIQNASLNRIKSWFEDVYKPLNPEGNPRTATADDLAAYLSNHLERTIKEYEKGKAMQGVEEPANMDDSI